MSGMRLVGIGRWCVCVALSALTFACAADVGSDLDEDSDLLRRGETGNGSPSGGSEFTLNVIGVPRDKSPNLTGGDGRRIFIDLFGESRILLSEGDFAVLDANGTDGQASFQLPSPDADGDGVTEYSVFARALGTPGGSARITTCGTEVTTETEICSEENIVLVRSTGRSRFANVSRELLFVFADLDGDGVVERIPLFDDRLEGFLWQIDNQGLRLAQLRFVEVPTDVN
ncbi:Hypothetical protein I5071_3080 [Sandaracinus amylolyticus]|nr:Hypothetical protein I5071_3080 [Sandaracinus amylolyticus]